MSGREVSRNENFWRVPELWNFSEEELVSLLIVNLGLGGFGGW